MRFVSHIATAFGLLLSVQTRGVISTLDEQEIYGDHANVSGRARLGGIIVSLFLSFELEEIWTSAIGAYVNQARKWSMELDLWFTASILLNSHSALL